MSGRNLLGSFRSFRTGSSKSLMGDEKKEEQTNVQQMDFVEPTIAEADDDILTQVQKEAWYTVRTVLRPDMSDTLVDGAN